MAIKPTQSSAHPVSHSVWLRPRVPEAFAVVTGCSEHSFSQLLTTSGVFTAPCSWEAWGSPGGWLCCGVGCSCWRFLSALCSYAGLTRSGCILSHLPVQTVPLENKASGTIAVLLLMGLGRPACDPKSAFVTTVLRNQKLHCCK